MLISSTSVASADRFDVLVHADAFLVAVAPPLHGMYSSHVSCCKVQVRCYLRRTQHQVIVRPLPEVFGRQASVLLCRSLHLLLLATADPQ